MKHLSIDLETLSLNMNAVIVSVGAVFFDPVKGERGHELYLRPDMMEQQDLGRRIDPSVLEWWSKQSVGALGVFQKPQVGAELFMNTFAGFLNRYGPDSEVMVWGNGANFDNAILTSYFMDNKRPIPWSFRNDRCLRTLKMAAKLTPEETPAFDGVQHNALDDAIYQAEVATACMRKLGLE